MSTLELTTATATQLAQVRAAIGVIAYDSVAQLLTSSAAGKAAGTVYRAGRFSYVEVAAGEDITTSGGIKLQALTPDAEAFGAVPDGTTDSTDALQLFFDAISARDVGEASINGEFAVSSGLTYGSSLVTPETKYISGRFSLIATEAIESILTLENCSSCRWDHVSVRGTGGVSFASRTVKRGLTLINCGRSYFQSVNCNNFSFSGIAAYSGNNSFTNFGDVKVSDCGSGAVDYSLTGTWSNPVNAGSSGSVSQSTTIDVTQLPPDWITDGTHGVVGDTPYMVRLDGRLYYIESVDTVNSKLTVFPWVASSATPGEFQYHFGAGVYLRGSDCNVTNFDQVDGIRCSTPLASTSLYGPAAKRITSQFCGSGLVVGRTPSGASLGGNYQNCYFENNSEDIILVMRSGANGYNYFWADYALNLAKCYRIGSPRLTGDSISSSLETFTSQVLTHGGRMVLFDKPSRNNVSSTTTIGIERRDHVRVQKQDSPIFTLDDFDAELNRLTGVDSFQIMCLGTGADNVPAGTITFNPPSGWTVNGSSSAAFSSFTVPPHFVVFYDLAATNIIVRKLN